MTAINLWLAAWVVTVPFSVQPLDGESQRGELVSLNSTHVVLTTDTGQQTLPLEQVAVLAREGETTNPAISTEAGFWLELTDGTSLPAKEYTVVDGQAHVVSFEGTSRTLPTRQIRSVRLTLGEPRDAKLLKQWAEITASKATGDLLVVQKNDALDYLEGILRNLDAETCHFELEGELIPVKRSRIAGLVYARPASVVENPEPIARLSTRDGSRLAVRGLQLTEDTLRVETPGGVSFDVPLEQVNRLDFSTGKIAYLSDLDPERAVFTPLVAFAKPSATLSKFFSYRRDEGFEQQPLKLDGKEFRKGLALASRTELVYRLPDKFRVFRTTAGIDDATRHTGSVRLEIRGDGKLLWEGEVRGDEPAQEIEIEIVGVRRLELLADYGVGLDVGDRLDLANAQVTK